MRLPEILGVECLVNQVYKDMPYRLIMQNDMFSDFHIALIDICYVQKLFEEL
jgi:hypothetical protein